MEMEHLDSWSKRVWILRSLFVKGVPEMDGSLIKQIRDYLITLPLSVLGRARETGRVS